MHSDWSILNQTILFIAVVWNSVDMHNTMEFGTKKNGGEIFKRENLVFFRVAL
jgi:phosphodiesterase/alkaline phosphatase D-like protein